MAERRLKISRAPSGARLTSQQSKVSLLALGSLLLLYEKVKVCSNAVRPDCHVEGKLHYHVSKPWTLKRKWRRDMTQNVQRDTSQGSHVAAGRAYGVARYLALSGAIWRYLGLSEAIWGYLVPSGAI